MADVIRARLLGKGSPSSASAAPAAPKPSAKEVVLPTVTLSGSLIRHGPPLQSQRPPPSSERFKSHAQDGIRESYFADEAGVNLGDLVREQKLGGGADVDELVAGHISKRKAFKVNHLGPDEEYDNDSAALAVLGQTGEKKRRRRHHRGDQTQEDHARQRQIQAFQR